MEENIREPPCPGRGSEAEQGCPGASMVPPALTYARTLLVCIHKGHDGAQGHLRVIPEVLQAADGILEVFCRENPPDEFRLWDPRAGMW